MKQNLSIFGNRCVFTISISPIVCGKNYSEELDHFVNKILTPFLSRSMVDWKKSSSNQIICVTKRFLSDSDLKILFDSINPLRYLSPEDHVSKFSIHIGFLCGNFKSNHDVINATQKSISAAFVATTNDIPILEYDFEVQKNIDLFEYLNRTFSSNTFNKNIWPVFQPIYSKNKEVLGYECLLRMKDESSTFIPPYKVIEFLEKTGQGEKVFSWFMKTVISECEQFLHKNQYVSVNVSPKSLTQKSYIDTIKQAARKINGKFNLVVEITETGDFNSSLDRIKKVTEDISPLGVIFALDDFGIGSSNFDVIFALNPEIIKLDRTFIEFLSKEDYYGILSLLCKGLSQKGHKIIFEGVETFNDFDLLCGLDIYGAQGFYLGKPEPLRYYLDREDS